MICKQCGCDSEYKVQSRDPWCMYKIRDGRVVSETFDPLYVPNGWHDSPKAAKEAEARKAIPLEIKSKNRSKKPKKVKNNVNGSGFNK
ncbi:hypothetical protein [uncultured Paraglaciecola sp.]|uniref:hypothetical protein n=1 Tax=uncultured Paraglaciecola sp. TaxID=1765024 RepID=UPI0026129E9A|nr:hypothetical protein [uncultured Paraglaciecola sp.]